MVQSSSAGQAKSYFDDSLARGDYYLEGQEMAGRWGGKAAKKLGLEGEVSRDGFRALCDHVNPATGEKLTPLARENRRVGYDINFHAPKSVSLAFAETGDARIVEAFRDSVNKTMERMEAEMQARRWVPEKGTQDTVATGNLVWAEFVHFTSRPVDGVPDPHLHAHCFTFNATYDPMEERFKAGEFGGLKRDAPYFQAAFHAELASNLKSLGYGIERTHDSFELAGVGRDTIERFSRRTAQIEAEAEARGITSDRDKDGLGALTREYKRKDLSLSDLHTLWRERLTPDERQGLVDASKLGATTSPGLSPGDAVNYAVGHCFERASVIPEKRLMAEALHYGVGSVAVADVERSTLARADFITRTVNGEKLVTTAEVLAEEKAMIDFARAGRGTCSALGNGDRAFQNLELGREQKDAVEHVLSSSDKVIALRGAAGTGKTTLMKEAVAAIEERGKGVVVLAPSAEASRGVLRSEGFSSADTVARFLSDPDLQESAKGGVIWVDEAGLLGSKTMNAVFEKAEALKARVVLSGDERQHAPVERGDALAILRSHGGVKVAEVTEIYRQKGEFKAAIAELSQGNVADYEIDGKTMKGGFSKLDELGAIIEVVNDDERHQRLAADYLGATASGRSALVVSPTHAEGEKVTAIIREKLKESKTLGDVDKEFTRCRNLNWTAAEKGDARNYTPGQVVEFVKSVSGGLAAGEKYTVASVDGGKVLLNDARGKQTGALTLDKPARFSVYAPEKASFAKGDLVRVTKNGRGFGEGGKRTKVTNGQVYKLAGFTKSGDLKLTNGTTLSKNFGHLTHGYAATSHGSQGKTVDRVFVAQSAESFRAGSTEQFYVSASRAREKVSVYTDDKNALRQAVQRSSLRMSATELAKPQEKASVFSLLERALGVNRLKQHAEKAAAGIKRTATLAARYGRVAIGMGREQNRGIDR